LGRLVEYVVLGCQYMCNSAHC